LILPARSVKGQSSAFVDRRRLGRRGHTHTVLVREEGFEYEGQRYRSLTVIAERITGAHWSGPRFFGLGERARAS
jgi:hypothetical protein